MLKIKSKILSDIILINLGSIFTKIFYFLFIVLIGRYLGTEFFGFFGTANTFSIFLMTFFSFGSGFYLTREVSFNKEISKDLFNGIIKIRIILFFISFLFIAPLIYFNSISTDFKVLMIIFFMIGFFKGFIQQFNQLYQAYRFFRAQVFFDFILYFGLFIIGLYSYFLELKIVPLGTYILSLYLIIFIIELIFIKKNILEINLIKWNYKKLKEIFINALPFLFATLVGIIYHRIDIFMIGFYHNQSDVGLYVAPYNLYEAFLFIPAAFGNAIFPRLVPLIKMNHLSFVKKHLGGIMYLLLIVILPIIIILISYSKSLIELIFGSSYISGSIVLAVISIGLFFHSFNNIFGRILYAYNLEKYQLKISFLAMLLNVFLNLILIPKYSLIGASISTVLSFLLSFILHFLKVKRVLKFKFIFNNTQLIKLIILSILFIILVTLIIPLIELNFLFSLIISIIFYLLFLTLLERDKLRSIIRNKF